MNKSFEEQVKNQVQVREYIPVTENFKRLVKTKKKLEDIENLIENLKQDVEQAKQDEKKFENLMMSKLRFFIRKSNNYSCHEITSGYAVQNNKEKFNCLLKIIEQQNRRITELEKLIPKN